MYWVCQLYVLVEVSITIKALGLGYIVEGSEVLDMQMTRQIGLEIISDEDSDLLF